MTDWQLKLTRRGRNMLLPVCICSFTFLPLHFSLKTWRHYVAQLALNLWSSCSAFWVLCLYMLAVIAGWLLRISFSTIPCSFSLCRLYFSAGLLVFCFVIHRVSKWILLVFCYINSKYLLSLMLFFPLIRKIHIKFEKDSIIKNPYHTHLMFMNLLSDPPPPEASPSHVIPNVDIVIYLMLAVFPWSLEVSFLFSLKGALSD